MTNLHTRLTLTYTLVTVAALLALEIIVLGGLMALLGITRVNESQYLLDVYAVLNTHAPEYFQQDDMAGLQAWVTQRYASGAASAEPSNLADSAAALFAMARPFVVLDAGGTIVAQAPLQREVIGRPYIPPDDIDPIWFAEHATKSEFDPLLQYQPLADGSWYLLVPVQTTWGKNVWGTMVLHLVPAPSILSTYLPLFGAVVVITAVALLLGVAPFGAWFGYMMARNLTRRLANLEGVAMAYSKGDFAAAPQDDTQDEIGRLGARLKEMAQEIEMLLQSRQELAALEERNRLARELHDTVKQQNFATLMQIRAAKNLAGQEQDTTVTLAHLETAETLLKQSQQDLHGVIAELRPAQLAGHGLPAALRLLVQDWSAQNGVVADVLVQGERPLQLTAQQTLYRVAQEALANISRHSHASQVTVRLHYTSRTVSLAIADNGQGFDTEAVGHGFGLSSMKQRLTETNGQLDIDSHGENGTVITAVIEIKPVPG